MSLLSFIKRKILRLSKDRWNYQYEQGQWDGLQNEQERFEVVISFLKKHFVKPTILEIGCGEAILLRKLKKEEFDTFVGIDLSDVAIQNAQVYQNERVAFEAADMEDYQPKQFFDAIIFTESFYYSKNPAKILHRYTDYLTENGIFIISAVENKYTSTLWVSIENSFKVIDSQVIEKDRIMWNVKVVER